jgi:sugar/nucleoside kinase (ribokinase family)
MIGVGGIGAGMFFALNGNHTLGREESRSGRFLDRRDYCKLHIVSHYVQTLLGPGFHTLPVGKVGDDDVGRQLVDEMNEAGLDTRYVQVTGGAQTLFSFCFIYPDESGGNMSTDDSACSRVDPSFVETAEVEFSRFRGRGIALAVPEVPLAARLKILELGSKYDFFRAASFTAEEIGSVVASDVLLDVDLLAVNLNEAASVIGARMDKLDAEQTAKAAVGTLRNVNPRIELVVTAGAQGSWGWDGSELLLCPPIPAETVSTAGAGDAFLAGMLVGKVAGLRFAAAQQLANLVAAGSVTSPHTINKDLDRQSLAALARQMQPELGGRVWALLED